MSARSQQASHEHFGVLTMTVVREIVRIPIQDSYWAANIANCEKQCYKAQFSTVQQGD